MGGRWRDASGPRAVAARSSWWRSPATGSRRITAARATRASTRTSSSRSGPPTWLGSSRTRPAGSRRPESRMPELPDVTVYIEALRARILGEVLERVRVANPFLVRSVDPPIQALVGRPVVGLRRLGKRIVVGFEGELFLIVHLMIA